jgi:hypothetical protein
VSFSAPIKIYLGTQVEQSLAVDVLTYSIVSHTRQAVLVTPLYEAVQAAGIDIPTPRSPQLRPRTPFTFQRFAIPAICQYQGRALYLDSDMLVFRDIDELWQQSFVQTNGETADLLSVPEPEGSGRSPQYSVMLLNCDQLKWDAPDLVSQLEQGRWSYDQFVLEMAPAARKAANLPLGWNDLERYEPNRTALLHYTDMPRQPWLSVVNPFAALWCEALLQAIASGFISIDRLQDSIDRGWVRPSLRWQVAQGVADPQQLPVEVLARDRKTFVPPHVWQKYLRHPLLQQPRSRQYFSFAYAGLKSMAQGLKAGLKAGPRSNGEVAQ